ncbi:MAG TPA: adenylate/guanylate cyclase domain-containing protein [Nitrososphaeraceae archaeon]|nr:adenylate/guanylate cyclase domain-containing protein [Nitrososphaeraceae archaeon]
MDNEVIIQRDDKWDPRRKKYFHPRFAIVLQGQEIKWTNHDTRNHRLVSGNPDTLISDGVFDSGEILIGKSGSIRFNTSERASSISYFCSLHPNERGIVIVLPREGGLLSDEQRLQLLESTLVHNGSSEFKKMHTSLEKYVDPVVLEQIRDPELVTMQNKILTIVFWDLSGFSVLCEKLKSHKELIVEFLREYFSEAAIIIQKHKGVLDKFMGDGIMAFFGYKDTDANDNGRKGAISAVKAAIELRNFFDEMKLEWINLWITKTDQQVISTDLRCGMNTGNVLVGLILTDVRDQFTTIGSNVNLASRLESVANKDQIIVSPSTKIRIKDQFSLRTIPIERPIKGFENISECYEIIDKKQT